jgi:hypothetical protein
MFILIDCKESAGFSLQSMKWSRRKESVSSVRRMPKMHFSFELLIFLEFRTGNFSRRSSNPFRSDIDRSWFDMVYALLVPGRVNFSIS